MRKHGSMRTRAVADSRSERAGVLVLQGGRSLFRRGRAMQGVRSRRAQRGQSARRHEPRLDGTCFGAACRWANHSGVAGQNMHGGSTPTAASNGSF
jgi:hypothetical protein